MFVNGKLHNMNKLQKGDEKLVCDTIVKMCEERKMSLAALERAAGIGNGVIGKWRSLERTPNLKSLEQIAKALEVPITELLKDEEG